MSIALPWLEAMGPSRAWAAPAVAQRFVAVYTPGGTVMNKWRPTGTENAPVLSPILQPLNPIKQKLLVLDGLSLKSAIGEQHQAGLIAFLSGTPQSSAVSILNLGPAKDVRRCTILHRSAAQSHLTQGGMAVPRPSDGLSAAQFQPCRASNARGVDTRWRCRTAFPRAASSIAPTAAASC